MKTLFCDLDNTLLFQLENGTYGIKDNDLKALQKALWNRKSLPKHQKRTL